MITDSDPAWSEDSGQPVRMKPLTGGRLATTS